MEDMSRGKLCGSPIWISTKYFRKNILVNLQIQGAHYMVVSSLSTITSKLVLVLIYPKSNDTIILSTRKNVEGVKHLTHPI
jgi:hypothetical protein